MKTIHYRLRASFYSNLGKSVRKPLLQKWLFVNLAKINQKRNKYGESLLENTYLIIAQQSEMLMLSWFPPLPGTSLSARSSGCSGSGPPAARAPWAARILSVWPASVWKSGRWPAGSSQAPRPSRQLLTGREASTGPALCAEPRRGRRRRQSFGFRPRRHPSRRSAAPSAAGSPSLCPANTRGLWRRHPASLTLWGRSGSASSFGGAGSWCWRAQRVCRRGQREQFQRFWLWTWILIYHCSSRLKQLMNYCFLWVNYLHTLLGFLEKHLVLEFHQSYWNQIGELCSHFRN